MADTQPTGPKATLWQKSLKNSKAGFDKLWAAADKLGDPVNRWSNKVGSEAFWPTTLDRESDKAARILQSFCKDGFYSEEIKKADSKDEVKGRQRVIKKIPEKVIQEAKGLAIFTTMRSGLWVSGAGGSGIVVARKEDGTWSEPAGIMLHTAGLGWLIGVDIYDCVLVLRTQKAVDAFRHMRWTVGGELSAVAGPYGAGGYVETEMHKRQAPIFTYLKSRGFYAGVQVDGTVVIERTDENERFYGSRISCTDILAGKVRHPPERALRMLKATLKAAQGDAIDESILPSGPAPADYQVEESGHVFGVPDREDPDPFGVHALEQEGLKLNDAATHAPAPEQELEFHPSEQSPIYPVYNKVKPEEKERERIRMTHKLPPPYSGPRADVSDAGTRIAGATRRSVDIGTQTIQSDDDSLTRTTQTNGVGMTESSRDEPASATPRKQAPPALPPRASSQPIQLEDNEPTTVQSSKSPDEPVPGDAGSSGPPTKRTFGGEGILENKDHSKGDISVVSNGDDLKTKTGTDAAAASKLANPDTEEPTRSYHHVPGGFD